MARVCLAFATLTPGCQKPNPPTPPIAAPPSLTTPVIADPNAPLADEDYQEFGRKLESAVTAGDKPAVVQLFRMKEIQQRVDRELESNLSPADREGLRLVSEGSGGRLGTDVTNAVKDGGSYSSCAFTRWTDSDGY